MYYEITGNLNVKMNIKNNKMKASANLACKDEVICVSGVALK